MKKVANIILLTLLLLITGAAPVLAEKELPIELQKLADEAYRSYSERETDNFFEYYQSHDLQTAEIKAKQAIRERITSPWQRSFSQNQRIDLGYYAGIFSDVIPSELFRHLYEDVINEPDVARKPEKWKTDTLKELNGIAEGIIREEARGLHL